LTHGKRGTGGAAHGVLARHADQEQQQGDRVAQDRTAPRLRAIESLPNAGLLAASVALVLHDGPRLAYRRAAADSLRARKLCIGAVMGARPVLPNAEATP
jgi:hypothetical protein